MLPVVCLVVSGPQSACIQTATTSEPMYTPVWSILMAASPSVMSELCICVCVLAVPFHSLYLSITL